MDDENNKEVDKRGPYNKNYNINQLLTLTLLFENDEFWLSTVQLADISGRKHKHVLEDVRRDLLEGVVELKQELQLEDKKVAFLGFEKIILPLSNTDKKIVKRCCEIQPFYKLRVPTVGNKELKDVMPIYGDDNRFGIIDAINNIKVKEDVYIDEKNRKQKMFLLNDRAALVCLLRYSLAVRIHIANLFLEQKNF
nr:MAG TPA: hypothetical protein [Caudoviricetes sp.]